MMPCYICYDLERPEAPQHRGPDRMPERVVARTFKNIFQKADITAAMTASVPELTNRTLPKPRERPHR